MSGESFSGYAIVEVMGHNKYIGMVEETTLAGAGVLRVDVPEVPASPGREGIRAFVKFFPPGSIYCVTPISKEEADAAFLRLRATPHNIPMIGPGYGDVREVIDDIEDEPASGHIDPFADSSQHEEHDHDEDGDL